MRQLLKVMALGASLLAAALGLGLLVIALSAGQDAATPWGDYQPALVALGLALTVAGLVAYLILALSHSEATSSN